MSRLREWRLVLRLPGRLRNLVYRAKRRDQSVNDWLLHQVRLGLEAHIRYTDRSEGD